MGRSGLSSKRKYSKKKSLKVSSEARRKKRSRRNKSKKLRCHGDSFSSYSYDESTSSSLVSSSSSEGEYKSRRARPHSRNEVKASRKRTRRRYSSEESSKDSPPMKKRKGSKKKDDSETRKKKKKNKKKKKKPRKDVYPSSAGSDSVSCSTCRDGDSSSDEGASVERPRGRSREKKKDHRDSIKGRNVHRKNRSRPRSSSSPSKLSNSYDDDSIEKVMVENNSRRLKSVITVAKQPEEEEGNDMKKDELKEEIVYDYDDYPSCKSNDSNDGENKKEVADHSNVSSEKRRIVASVIGEVNSASSLKDNKSISPGMSASKEYVDYKEKESNASGDIGSEVDNLESVLRQKALENLSRFRGGLQTKAVVPVDNKHKSDQSDVKQSPAAIVNFVQTQSQQPAPEQDGFSMMGVSQPVIQRSRFTWRRDPSLVTGKEGKKAATYSGTDSGGSQAPAPKLQSANLSSTSRVVNKTAYGKSKNMANTNNSIGGIGTNDDQKSTTALETPSCASTEEGSSKEQQTETKDNSQFEQKTMSVMRGGEMVQVSYKVYIPKKAPALARRQLKR